MRHVKLLLTMVMAIAAITAIEATTASAEEGLLPIGATFTGKAGAGTLETLRGLPIQCAGFILTGGVVNTESGKIAHIDFEKCTVLGFPAPTNSLGDQAEIVLVDNVTILLCLITPASLVFGVLLKLTEPVHLVAPTIGVLLNINGTIVGKIEPNGSGTVKKIVFEKTGGDASIKECTNLLTGKAEKDELTVELDGAKSESSGISQTTTFTFNKVVELMDK
jgi:hypothetical protein